MVSSELHPYFSSVARTFRRCVGCFRRVSSVWLPLLPPSFRTGEQTCSPLQRLMRDPSTVPASERGPARRREREMGLCIGLSLGKRDPLRLRHLALQGGGKGIPLAHCGGGRLVMKGSSSLLPGDRWPTPLLFFSPLAGEMPEAEGGALFGSLIWSSSVAPLCHSVTSPPARGGEGIRELFKGLRQAGTGSWGMRGHPSRSLETASIWQWDHD